MLTRILTSILLGLMVVVPTTASENPAAQKQERKLDLGDIMQGTFQGDVISDSQGSSRDDVQVVLTRVGVNLVRITSDYSRLPVVTVRLRRAMSSIVDSDGSTSFAYDTSKRPETLDISFNNEVSWSGVKASAGSAAE